MFARLTPSASQTLNSRWHDQTLDLESLRFDKRKSECTFLILLRREDGSVGTTSLLQERQLQPHRVTIRNATAVQLVGTEGEAELYVETTEASLTRIVIRCVNGTIELIGQDMEVSEECLPGSSAGSEVILATPLGDISWHRKSRKA